jgi:predicted secreted acid phosphatase
LTKRADVIRNNNVLYIYLCYTEAAKDKFVLILDITQNREYEITVTVTDFLGGTDVIQHTLVKTNDNLPNVDFLLSGIDQGFGTKYLIYPNTMYVAFSYFKHAISECVYLYLNEIQCSLFEFLSVFLYQNTKV